MQAMSQYMNLGHLPVTVHSPVKRTYPYQSWLCALITWNSIWSLCSASLSGQLLNTGFLPSKFWEC
jgi:hypothetical protein